MYPDVSNTEARHKILYWINVFDRYIPFASKKKYVISRTFDPLLF